METKSVGDLAVLVGAAGFVSGDVICYLTLLGGLSIQTHPSARGVRPYVSACRTAGCGDPRADPATDVARDAAGLRSHRVPLAATTV